MSQFTVVQLAGNELASRIAVGSKSRLKKKDLILASLFHRVFESESTSLRGLSVHS